MSENWKIQVSPKLPDGTLVNIRAESGDELTALLNYATANAQLITDTAAILAAARNASGVTQPAPANPATQPITAQAQQQYAQPQQGGFQAPGQPAGVIQFPQQGQPQQQAAPAQGGVQACEHGQYIWKDFVSQKGNQVKGFFCPANFRTQCKPDFRK
jgi:hypothetical protein